MGADGDLGLERCLVGGRDAGEVLDLAGAGLLVQAFGVTLLGDLDRDVDVDLDEGEGLVAALGTAGGVQLAGDLAVGPVGADEGGQGDGGAVGEQLGDLSNAADVLVAVLLAEAQVLVQTEAHVVAVQTVRRHAQVQQVLLQRCRHRRLARRRQACEPDGEALLLAEALTLLARERRVPGDVAVAGRRIVSLWRGKANNGTLCETMAGHWGAAG